MSNSEDHQIVRAPQSSAYNRHVVSSNQTTNLADLLERVLDKGIVIAGDITLSLGEVEVLNLKIRLLIASIDKAQEIGINWWQSDPALSSRAKELEDEKNQLKERLDRLEARLAALPQPAGEPQEAGQSQQAIPPQEADQPP
jgi:chromosome segregation ATPase